MLKILAAALTCLTALSMHASVHAQRVTPTGVESLKIGMTVKQLSKQLGEKIVIPREYEGNDEHCFYYTPKRFPKVSLMIIEGKFARIDVTEAGPSTLFNIQVGDEINTLVKNFNGSLKVDHLEYTSGEEKSFTYLTADKRRGIRFGTNKGRIGLFYAGNAKAIQYIEGCL
jgi:hypothetical protein